MLLFSFFFLLFFYVFQAISESEDMSAGDEAENWCILLLLYSYLRDSYIRDSFP